MRVLHVVKLDPRVPGGIERFAHELMSAQVAAGIDVHAVGCSADRAPAAAPPYGLALARTWATLSHLPCAPGFPRLVRREIARLAPEVVHLHWPNPLVLDLARHVPETTRLVVHWHADIDPHGANAAIRAAYALRVRSWERRLLARADAIVATSAEYAAASAPLAAHRARLAIVPLGLDIPPPAEAAPWPFERGRRVLFIGRAVPYKGFEVLVDAIAALPDATLVAIGDGPARAGWMRHAERRGVADRIRFEGHVDDAAKHALLAACDVVCVPSTNRLEAFGVVLLEAACARRAIVAADVPGSGVGHVALSLGGTTFPVGDATALATALGAGHLPPSALRDAYRIGSVEREIAGVYAARA